MSTIFYGSTVSYWRAYGEYTTTETSTSVTISLSGGWNTLSWRFSLSHVDCTATIGSTSSSVTDASVQESSSGTYTHELATASATISKTTSAQSVTIKVVAYNHSGYKDGTSTATTTVTVPALASYTISYDANGGSGAPSSQTKYYGQTLTLSSTKPTRSGYNFLGWSTSSSATSATYSAGGSYTANSAATLYAVWQAAIIAPTLSNVQAYRCDSDGTANDEGTYVYCSVTYAADTGYLSSNVVKSIKFVSSSGTTKTVSPGVQSGTATTILSGHDADSSYTITMTATDTNGSTKTSTAKVGTTAFVLDVNEDATGVGLLRAAPDSGVAIGNSLSDVYLGGYRIELGSSSVSCATDSYYASVDVTFEQAYGSSPYVFVTVRHNSSGKYHCKLLTKSVTGFSLSVWSSSSSDGTVAFDWLAIGT